MFMKIIKSDDTIVHYNNIKVGEKDYGVNSLCESNKLELEK